MLYESGLEDEFWDNAFQAAATSVTGLGRRWYKTSPVIRYLKGYPRSHTSSVLGVQFSQFFLRAKGLYQEEEEVEGYLWDTAPTSLHGSYTIHRLTQLMSQEVFSSITRSQGDRKIKEVS